MRRGLITRRNLIRAGIAAPFLLPKYAEALTAKQVLTDLGGAGIPQPPAGYKLLQSSDGRNVLNSQGAYIAVRAA